MMVLEIPDELGSILVRVATQRGTEPAALAVRLLLGVLDSEGVADDGARRSPEAWLRRSQEWLATRKPGPRLLADSYERESFYDEFRP